MSDCCKIITRVTHNLCENIMVGGATTAASALASSACGASGALVGVTAAAGALYGATAGVVFYVTVTVMEQITRNERIQMVVSVIFATIASCMITAAILGGKVTIAAMGASALMTCASIVTCFALLILANAAQEVMKECCKEEKTQKKAHRASEAIPMQTYKSSSDAATTTASS